jgi:hypothetical protein
MAAKYVPISDQPVEEVRARAIGLRAMAATASTRDVMEALLKLAERYEEVAAQKEKQRSH